MISSVSHYIFKVNGIELKIRPRYKYLGAILDEHLNFKECSVRLADSVGRALCKIIGQFKTYKDVNYKTLNILQNCGIFLIGQCWTVVPMFSHLTSIKTVRKFITDQFDFF